MSCTSDSGGIADIILPTLQKTHNRIIAFVETNARLKGKEEFVTSLSDGFHSPEGGPPSTTWQ